MFVVHLKRAIIEHLAYTVLIMGRTITQAFPSRCFASLGLIMYQRRTIWAEIKQTMASGFLTTGSVGGN